jgi:hypothetical protein
MPILPQDSGVTHLGYALLQHVAGKPFYPFFARPGAFLRHGKKLRTVL